MDPAWHEVNDRLVRDYTFADFATAVRFVDRVADAAEAQNHHPDVMIHNYRHVMLVLYTHASGRMTDADRALAEAIDDIGDPP